MTCSTNNLLLQWDLEKQEVSHDFGQIADEDVLSTR